MDRKEAIEYWEEFLEEIPEIEGMPQEEKDKQEQATLMAIAALQQPQVGGVEINKDFETILLCAVRYAIGRRSYMPSLVIDYITPLLPYLSDECLMWLDTEIVEHSNYGGLGDEKIDRPYWEQFLWKIRAEREKRK